MDLETIEKEYKENMDNLKNLSNNQKKDIYKESFELIKYFENMTGKTEERRNSIYSTAVNSLNIIIGFLTLIISINISNENLLPFFVPVYVFCAISIINELFVMVVFWMQSSSKYVSKDARLEKYGNYWKWFYYGNKYIPKISTSFKRFLKVSGKNQNNAFDEESVEAYFDGLNYVVKQYKNETINEKAENNIKQLYLMQVINYYKNRYIMSLSSINNIFAIIRICGVLASIIAVLIIF